MWAMATFFVVVALFCYIRALGFRNDAQGICAENPEGCHAWEIIRILDGYKEYPGWTYDFREVKRHLSEMKTFPAMTIPDSGDDAYVSAIWHRAWRILGHGGYIRARIHRIAWQAIGLLVILRDHTGLGHLFVLVWLSSSWWSSS